MAVLTTSFSPDATLGNAATFGNAAISSRPEAATTGAKNKSSLEEAGAGATAMAVVGARARKTSFSSLFSAPPFYKYFLR